MPSSALFSKFPKDDLSTKAFYLLFFKLGSHINLPILLSYLLNRSRIISIVSFLGYDLPIYELTVLIFGELTDHWCEFLLSLRDFCSNQQSRYLPLMDICPCIYFRSVTLRPENALVVDRLYCHRR